MIGPAFPRSAAGTTAVALLFAMVGTLTSSPARGQAHVAEVESRPFCDSCTIELDLIAEFGNQDDGGMVLTRWMLVFGLPQGRWVSIDQRDQGAFRFYDSSGRFTHRIDAHGRGPGEYQVVTGIFETSDGYLLFDPMLGRLSWVDDDFEFLRSSSFPLQALRMDGLPNGDLVINSMSSPTAVARGHVIHVVDTAGNVKASFGGAGGPVDLRMGSPVLQRVIDATPEGTIWASRTNRYEPVSYTMDGDTIAALTRRADWFTPYDEHYLPEQYLARPPHPQVEDIISDDEGLVWVLLHVSDPRWEDAVRSRSDEREIPESNGYLDSVIEVLDPVAGTVVARTRVSDALKKVRMARRDDGGVWFYRLHQDQVGFFTVGILRANLIR